MLITRKSMITKIEHTIELDITQEQLDAYYNGMLVQNAFPNLTASEREFIMTGIVDDEWDEHIKDDEDDLDLEGHVF